MPVTPESIAFARAVAELAGPDTSSTEIAKLLGANPRHVRKVLQKLNLPRLPPHSPSGMRNAAYRCGRRIGLGGYATIAAPVDHPTAPILKGKNRPHILEHRLVMEQKLGRHLLPEEVVDHIDGLTLHNHPDNLRLFPTNAEHLRATISGQVPQWSAQGRENMFVRHRQPEALIRVDTYRQCKKAGAIRLRQILLAALQLGTDSPYLLGTHHHTTKAGIDMSQRSTIARALDDLSAQWGWVRTRS